MIQAILKKKKTRLPLTNYFMKQICSSNMYVPFVDRVSFYLGICLARSWGWKIKLQCGEVSLWASGWPVAAFLGSTDCVDLAYANHYSYLFKFNQWATIRTDEVEMNRPRSNKRLSVQTVLDWEAEVSSRNKYINFRRKKAEPELGSNSQKMEHLREVGVSFSKCWSRNPGSGLEQPFPHG